MKSLRFASFSGRARRHLIHLSALALVAITLVAQTSFALADIPERRIRFKRGATVARVTGHLKGINDEALFVLRARKGQHMRVEITGQGATRGFITSPSGEENGAPGGVVFDEDLTETGDYHIRVTESQMAEEWKGTFTLKVTITG